MNRQEIERGKMYYMQDLTTYHAELKQLREVRAAGDYQVSLINLAFARVPCSAIIVLI